MRRFKTAKLLMLLGALGMLLWGAGACSPTATVTVEPTEAPPSPLSPTSEAFESPLSPTSMPPPPLTPDAGAGGAKGVLVAFPPDWGESTLFVYFAPFYPGEKVDEGIFVLEPGTHPYTEIDAGGAFQFGSIPPGAYVIVIGPSAEKARAILEGERPRIFEIVEGQVLDLGELSLLP